MFKRFINFITITKTKKQLRWQFKLSVAAFVVIVVWLVHKPVLVGLAAYLEIPSSTEKSDVVFVDGIDVINLFYMDHVIEMVKTGKVDNIALALTGDTTSTNVFALQNYRQLVLTELNKLGIPDSVVYFLDPIFGDPYSYTLATGLVDFMKEHNFKSIALLQDNFHIKRSFLTYQKVMGPHGISVHPERLEIYLNKNNWWKNTNGVRRVYGEYYKLVYYKIRGYI